MRISAGVAVIRSLSQRAVRHATIRSFHVATPLRSLRLDSAAKCIPHPEKAHTGGEDAYLIMTPSERPDASAVGVADGVGGWAESGIDAGLYSRELMRQTKERLIKATIPCPQDSLAFAHVMTKERGSCTATIAVLGKDKTLHTANLGDSGFLIARAKEDGDTLQLLFKTPFQQHDFNTPFQLSTMGPDEPWHADVEKFQVESGDILVMGTDGLWDNVYDADVLEALSSGSTPQQMADRIGELAVEMAGRTTGKSPFADRGVKFGVNYAGGKMDDVTVVVARVSES